MNRKEFAASTAFVLIAAVLSLPIVQGAESVPAPKAPTGAQAAASRFAVRAVPGSHWLHLRGKPAILVGDSITQAWMELGANFDQRAYLDALARRGINALLLWSYIGVTDQRSDDRIGYDAPDIWPWVRREGRFDLERFNDAYFARLQELVRQAARRNIVVLITIHDGWTKTRFAGHPFNRAHGGPLQSRSQYVELEDYTREIPGPFDPAWPRRRQHQYYLERFCARLLDAIGGEPNVIYEMFNEGEWYNQPDLRAFQAHFLKFFDARTASPLAVNDDHVAGENFREEPGLDVISLHQPRWDDLPPARTFFDHYQKAFEAQPTRPVLFSEPVPEYGGDASRHKGVARLLWGTALGGAGVLFQNDASWGFDPRSALASKSAERDAVLDLEGHVARFFNASGIDLAPMRPLGHLSSTGICLAAP
ncbi:MAG: hypothetical protein ACYC6Y_32185, partial [Thermoguttaceae bacterium]